MFAKNQYMKVIYFLLLFAFVQSAHAQDFCKQIKKDISDDKTVFDFASPFDPVDAPPIRVTRNYSTNGEYAYDNFIVVFQVPCPLDDVTAKAADGSTMDKEEYLITVTFDDNTTIKDDTIKINHDLTDDRSQALRIAYFPLNARNIQNFTTKKITKFSLAKHELAVTPELANAVMHYIICIKAEKEVK